MKKFILIANGRAPLKKDILYLKSKGYDTIMCADGGANTAFRLKIVPDFIIGDLDSVKPAVLHHYQDISTVKRIPRQNDTDVEKVLKYALKQGFTGCCMTAVTGDRLDHSFGNLAIALKYSDLMDIRIISEQSYLTVISGCKTLRSQPQETISLFGFSSKTKFTTTGLKYRLDNESLTFGERESTSNVAVNDQFAVIVKYGKAFLIRDFQTIKKYDLMESDY